jgi:hypothetical protein
MAWCEANRVGYMFGLARNSRLEAALAAELAAAKRQHLASGAPARVFRDGDCEPARHVCDGVAQATLCSADHPSVLGPVKEGVASFGRGCHRIRSASRNCSSACNRAVGSWRGADLNRVILFCIA